MTEDQLEQLALTWFQDSGWEYRPGPDIAPDGATPERADYRQVVLTGRLREALVDGLPEYGRVRAATFGSLVETAIQSPSETL